MLTLKSKSPEIRYTHNQDLVRNQSRRLRNWLEEHYKSEREIWLVYYRKQAGKPHFSYNDAVEETLCFGWIDSIVKNIDQERYAQRFTPRKPKSEFSQTNKERLKKLIEQGRVMPDVLASLGNISLEDFEYPTDIMAAIRENELTWENFQRYSGSYQRIRIAYIDGARTRPGEYEKRLKHFIRMTEQNKQFGFGIEDYYLTRLCFEAVEFWHDFVSAALLIRDARVSFFVIL